MKLGLRTLSPLLFLAAALTAADAGAQFLPGHVNLPASDFVWIWGDREDAVANRRNDFTVNGSEAGFQCQLTVRLHLTNRFSPSETRELENQLRSSFAFIQEAAYTMELLDQRRDIEWALLDCDKSGNEDLSAEQRQQRVDRALERAREEQARRRAREQRRQQ